MYIAVKISSVYLVLSSDYTERPEELFRFIVKIASPKFSVMKMKDSIIKEKRRAYYEIKDERRFIEKVFKATGKDIDDYNLKTLKKFQCMPCPDYLLKESLFPKEEPEEPEEGEIEQITKGLVAFCFRNNTPLEDYHSEGVPISDERMKNLMIKCVNNVYFVMNQLLSEDEKVSSTMREFLRLESKLYTKEWNTPEEPEWIDELREALDKYTKESIEKKEKKATKKKRKQKPPAKAIPLHPVAQTVDVHCDEIDDDNEKLIKALDPDFTKLTPSEAKELNEAALSMENGDYVSEDEINWD